MMQSDEGQYGSLLFFRKDGNRGTSYSLTSGETTLGCSKEADIRLKINDERLEQIHCMINVSNNGIATLYNKSIVNPVNVNNIFVRKMKVLSHGDTIELIGKRFQYLNENISQKDVEKHQLILNEAISTTSKRQSVTPCLTVKSLRKTPNLRTKTPIKRRPSTRKSFTGSNTDFAVIITPDKKTDKRNIAEKSKTTSKVVVSKALRSPGSSKKRRFSLDINPKNFGRSPKISARNILLSENIVSSTISEENTVSPKPSNSMKKSENTVMESDVDEYLDKSSNSLQVLEELSQLENDSKKRQSSRTPRKSIKINGDQTPVKTPRGMTPTMKKLEILKQTPVSLQKSLHVYSSPRNSSSKKANKSIGLNQDIENLKTPTLDKSKITSMFSPKSTRKSTKTIIPNLTEKLVPTIKISSARKSLSISKDRIDNLIGKLSISKSRDSDLKTRVSLNKTEEIHDEGNSFERYAPKNLQQFASEAGATTDRKKVSGRVYSEDLSSEESFSLNLSSNSSASPLNITSRKSLASTNSDFLDKMSPNEVASVTKNRALQVPKRPSTKSRQSQRASSINKHEENNKVEQHSFNEDLFDSSGSEPVNSPTSEDLLLQSFPDKSFGRSRQSWRKINRGKEEAHDGSNEESVIVVSESPNKSRSKSRQSLRKSRTVEYEEDLQNNSILSISLTISEQSVRKSITKRHTEDLSTNEEYVLISKSQSRNTSIRKSYNEPYSSSEESFLQEDQQSLGEEDLREGSEDLQYSSSEESLPLSESQSPNISLSRSSQSLRRSKNGVDELLTVSRSKSLNTFATLRNSSSGMAYKERKADNESDVLSTSVDLSKKRTPLKTNSALHNENKGLSLLVSPSKPKTPMSETLTGRRSSRRGSRVNSKVAEESLSNSSVFELEQSEISKDRNSLRKSSTRYSMARASTIDEDLSNSLSQEEASISETLTGRRSSRRGSRINSQLAEVSLLNSSKLEQNEIPKDRNSLRNASSRYSMVRANMVDENLENSLSQAVMSETLTGRRSSRRGSRITSQLAEEPLLNSPVFESEHNEISKNRNSLRKSSTRYSKARASTLDKDARASTLENSLSQGEAVISETLTGRYSSRRGSRVNSQLAEEPLLNSPVFELEHNEISKDRNSLRKSSTKYSMAKASTIDEDLSNSLSQEEASISETLTGRRSSRRGSRINSQLAEVSLLNSSKLEQNEIPKDQNSLRNASSRYSMVRANMVDENLENSLSQEAVMSETLTGRCSSRRGSRVNKQLAEEPLLNSPVFELEHNEISKDRNSLRKSSTRYSKDRANMLEEDLENSLSQEVIVSEILTGRRSSRPGSRVNSQIAEESVLNSPIFELEQNKRFTDRNSFRKSSTRYSMAGASTMDEDLGNLFSQDEATSSLEAPDSNHEPRRRSLVNQSYLMNDQSVNETSQNNTSCNRSSKRSLARKSNISSSANKSCETPLITVKQDNISIITLSDSIDGTPENNTSIIFIDTPFEKTRRSSKRPSKTMNSTIHDDVELTTPKSAIKSRRSKSLPYNPLTEEITPVSPINKATKESGFKTPLNTPGLFEDIKKTVIRSRSRMQSNLMEELNKVEDKKASKRSRESSGSSFKPSKKRKVLKSHDDSISDTDNEDADTSLESFTTGDVLSDISDQFIQQNTPKYFSDLTNKPVITDPQNRSLTEPKKKRSVHLRRSLHAMRLESQLSSGSESIRGSDIISTSFDFSQCSDDVNIEYRGSLRRSSIRTQKNEVNTSHEKIQKSPKNDLSDVAGLKKLLTTPKEVRSPVNDLTDVRGVKQLFQMHTKLQSPKNDLSNVPNLRKYMYPKTVRSPHNDLTNLTGVKNLLSTPKDIRSPKNDLRNVPNLRRLMSPKKQNSPKNDLTNVSGVKKLLSTPKAANSPVNDLTKIPNLRRIMSPKHQKSPKNDLTEVHGLKYLMRTPKERKEPVNDLSDVEGVANIFNTTVNKNPSIESDIENNEDLFDKLFVKKSLKTYRGKSSSPMGKNASPFGQKGTPSSDVPYSSPRVEKWVEEQAVMNLEKTDSVVDQKSNIEKKPKKPTLKKAENIDSPKGIRRGRNKRNDTENDSDSKQKKSEVRDQELLVDNVNKVNSNKRTNKSRRKVQEKAVEISEDPEARRVVRRKRKVDCSEKVQTFSDGDSEVSFENKASIKEDINNEEIIEEQVPEPLPVKLPTAKRGRPRKTPQTEVPADQISEVHSTTEEVKSPVSKRGTGKRTLRNMNVVISPAVKRSGRRNNIQNNNKSEETVDSTEKTPQEYDEGIKEPKEEMAVTKTRGNVVRATHHESDVSTEREVPVKRGRGRKPKETKADESKSILNTNNAQSRRNNVIKSNVSVDDIKEEITVPEVRNRRRKIQTEEEPKAEEVVKKIRGRKPKQEIHNDMKTAEVVIKVDKLKNMEDQNAEEGKNEAADVTKKTSRSRRNAVENKEQESKVEPMPLKTTKRKRKQTVIKSDASDETQESSPKIIKKQTKVRALDELNMSVDSPRTTRAKRGNFNKYGDDFLTDDSMKEEGKAKKVHFEDGDSECSIDKKCRGRNVEKVVATQDPIRRSKRTRK